MEEPNIRWGFKMAYKRQGLTLSELADRSQIPIAYLSHFANGRFVLNGDQLGRLAKILNVGVDELVPNGAGHECAFYG